MPTTLTWINHASFRIASERAVVYIDPWKIPSQPKDANVVLVSHSHYDHLSPDDIAKVLADGGQVFGPPDVTARLSNCKTVAPGEQVQIGVGGTHVSQPLSPTLPPRGGGKTGGTGVAGLSASVVRLRGVAAYNVDKKFHPRGNNWLGWIVELDGKRIYYAGDTDLTPAMSDLGTITVALLPVGGTYTMDPSAAAEAVARINPQRALPYHWGDIVGTRADAEKFAELVGPRAVVLAAGESLTLA